MKSWGILLLVVLGLVLIPFVLFGDLAQQFIEEVLRHHRGPWMVAFLICALLVDVLLPIPSSLVSSYACQQFGWLGGFAVIFSGMCGAFVVAYVLGRRLGMHGAKKQLGEVEYQRALEFGEGRGAAFALALSRAVPVLSEGVGLLSGAFRWPFKPALLWTSLANFGVAGAYALFFGVWGNEARGVALVLGSALIPAAGMLLAAAFSHKAARGA